MPMSAASSAGLPVVLVPGLNCSARLYGEQIPALWRFGAVTVADPTRDDTIAAMAARILAAAPPRFALAGLSMGGYIALEIMRRAPERVDRLALLDTGARPDTAEQTARRQPAMELARTGRFAAVAKDAFLFFVHPDRHQDVALKAVVISMAEDCGPAAYLRQQHAIIGRADSRPSLSAIACPTLMLVGEQDKGTPPELAREIAAAVRGARLVVVPHCGHLSTLEQPQAVTMAMVEWMQA
jgi:pimeloyl-ACP methyl ester carboxylesterase